MTTTDASPVAEVLATSGVRSVFQPIVDLVTGDVVAYEALARGPQGPMESPAALFPAARAEGLLAELDAACRTAAFRGAVDAGLVAPLTLFVNVEPEVLEAAPLDDLLAIATSAPGELRVMLEITERALAHRPAELLQAVQRVRDLGWGVALDDVGADPASLAFMSLLGPDVVKLDLSLVQVRPGPSVAHIMNAVNAYAERTGAVLLAEGIEDEQHLHVARALGATLGQGWYFGRPSPDPTPQPDVAPIEFRPRLRRPPGTSPTPFGALPDDAELRTAPKALLVELSKHLEREAMRAGETCVVAATFQGAVNFTAATASRYRDLVERTGFVCALGEGLPDEPVPGVRGASLDADDPLLGEWDVVVVSPHFSAALLATDLATSGPDMDRTFRYALTYDRPVVEEAARRLLAKVAPAAGSGPAGAPSPVVAVPPLTSGAPRFPVATTDGEMLLHRALSATSSGITIVDVRRPDQPLVYANAAFADLAGVSLAEIVGRNCRFLQGPDTDRAAVARVRAAIAEGRECRETLLNYRGDDRTPWWNEIYLAPVTDASGRVVQYIGVQNDVTARIEAERALVQERDRARTYLARIEELAYTDPLTGLMNRRRLESEVEAALWEARLAERGLALLFIDLDGFKPVNDAYGHAAGDELLVLIAQRIRGRLRRSDLLARLGGDEFLVALTGLDADDVLAQARTVADGLVDVIGEPATLAGADGPVAVSASIGISAFPADAEAFAQLVHVADERMYERKAAR